MLLSNLPATTAKLHLNYGTTTIQNRLKSSSTEVWQLGIERRRLAGRAGTGNWPAPHPRVVDKNQERYLGCGGPPLRTRAEGVTAPHQVPPPRVPVLRKEDP